MTYDFHVWMGLLAACIGALSFVPYFRDMLRGTTKPHPFTYGVWGLMNFIAFFAQDAAHAGPGAWVSGVVAFECLAVAAFSLRMGEKRITKLDWTCLILSILGVVLWRLTNNPLAAVVFVTVADALACVPTFRKSYLRPHEETISAYVMGSLRAVVSLFALTSFNLTTALYPLFIALADAALVGFLLIRRRQLAKVDL